MYHRPYIWAHCRRAINIRSLHIIHKDVQQGILTNNRLSGYVKSNPNIINEKNPDEGLTPLAEASSGGFVDVVDLLLERGAQADALCRDGETPLLIAAEKAKSNRSRIIQLLLTKVPPKSVDATCPRARGNTPLMFAITNRDIESIRLLRKAGASLLLKNDDNVNAEDLANQTNDTAIIRALDPEKEQADLRKLSSLIVTLLHYILAWVNEASNGIVKQIFKLDPKLDPGVKRGLDQAVNKSQRPSKEEFVQNVDKFVNEHQTLGRFFKDKANYIQEIAKKASELENDKSTSLGSKDLLPKTIKVSLYQQVIYCDDSYSMRFSNRWDSQKSLVLRIAQITTRMLPAGEGVALRFINQDVENSLNLSLQQVGSILENTSYKKGWNTPIGTSLRSKILEPLVYDKLRQNKFDRPLLISVVTDGAPSDEKRSEFRDVIVDCGGRLEAAGFPRDSVKFMVGQVGTASAAEGFLNEIRGSTDLANTVYCTTDKLDDKFSAYHDNESDLDRWLIETLFEPIKER
ncbi:hypothetical protein F4810DRAFT_710123 [Camillea tinctor]|nr:hypothetical protein F4810DRAFT_710123 [Camillea tinctor]